ncbi:hypothetical protein QBC46DRAFT_412021 [Diplogelasinospora grovesii]|uniref:Uncharacterized protein n=1 Tax=Diplogelasinospora grovesii TaxID=303347 RepID=A0AAN6MZQ7_9PEZI|nr:hypothetical protein QBC46DRAFT_412021 [Diplogelasinospora grovesii]
MGDGIPSAQRFAGIADLLRCLASQIDNTKLLYKLCLISRAFNAQCSFFLYREVRIGEEGGYPAGILDSKHLLHTRKVTVENKRCRKACSFFPWDHGESQDDYHSRREWHRFIYSLFEKTPQLAEVVWHKPCAQFYQDEFELLHSSCKKLESLHLCHLQYMAPRGGDISVFKGLRQLTLVEGDFFRAERLAETRTRQIVQVLKNSPQLETLCLGSYRRSTTRFDKLCDEYVAHGGLPLRLKSLTCAVSWWPQSAGSVAELTDPARLEEVYIWDCYYLPAIGIKTESALKALMPPACPNLRRFGIDGDFWDFATFCDVAAAMNKVSLAPPPATPDGFPYTPFRKSEWLRAVAALPMRPRMFQLGAGGPGDVLFPERAVLSCGPTLEGLIIFPVYNDLCMLLREGGKSRRLRSVLGQALGKMPNLTQFGISTGRRYPPQDCTDREHLRRLAATLALAATPRLQYINVMNRYWRIWRDDGSGVRLEELQDKGEYGAIELFSDRRSEKRWGRLYEFDCFWQCIYETVPESQDDVNPPSPFSQWVGRVNQKGLRPH